MSTLKTINIVHPSGSTTNIVNDSSGNMTVGGTMAMSSSFMRNRIINGAFDIWQRGTSFTSSSVNEYSADRWRTEGYNTNSVISQQTFTVGQTAVPGYPRYFCRVTTSSAPSNYWAFQQRIECPHNINGDGIYTLSFWVKAVSGTITAGTFKYGINDNSTYSNPTITTTWQKISVTQTLSGVSESSGYLSIYVVSIGSGVSSLSVDIANVQVEVGSVATPFEREIYSNTLAKCFRYFRQYSSVGNTNASTPMIGTGQAKSGGTAIYRMGWTMDIAMRVSPSVTFSGMSCWAGSNVPSVSAGTNYSGSMYVDLDCTTSGLTLDSNGCVAKLYFPNTSGYVQVSAEL